MSPSRSLVYFVLMFMLLWAYWTAALEPEQDAEQTKPRTGVFAEQFDERSPHSDHKRLVERMHLRKEIKVPPYDLADHTFQLVVPKAYDGSEAYGLLVFIHPNNNISLDRFYAQQIKNVLAKHQLIWVSYSGAGNPVLAHIRLGLALDAADNVMKRYRINDERVYVSGLSGGGRMTCMAGLYYPQVFTGGVPIVGSMYFRDVKMPTDEKLLKLIRHIPKGATGIWPQGVIEPKSKPLRAMKADQRWVLLAGEKDYNMPEMRAHFEQGFKADAFEHAHYLEVPGMGHNYPDAEWFEKAIEMLDAPLVEREKAKEGPVDEQTQRRAQQRLEIALRVLKRDEGRGTTLLKRLVKELPNTDAADTARAKLTELAKD